MWGKRKTKQKVVEFGFCLFMEMGKETNAFEFEFLIFFLQYLYEYIEFMRSICLLQHHEYLLNREMVQQVFTQFNY